MKVFKPFWSFNIEKTEAWLDEKAREGFELKDVNLYTKVFHFKDNEKKKTTNSIAYGINQGGAISAALKREGWTLLCSKKTLFNKRDWTFMENVKRKEDIKINPSREKLIKRLSLISGLFSAVMIYFSIIFISFSFLLLPLVIQWALGSNKVLYIKSVAEQSSIPKNMSYFTSSDITGTLKILAVIIVLIVIVRALEKRKKSLKSITKKVELLENESKEYSDVNSENERNSCLEDEASFDEDSLVVKKRRGWWFEPDKLEEWLEEMESKGLNLYKLDIKGTKFYFVKGRKRKIKYIADYQNSSDDSYYEIYTQDGWESVFASKGDFLKWTIWSKKYKEDIPRIYSERSDYLKQLRKRLFAYTCYFAPLLGITSYFFIKMLNLLPGLIEKDRFGILPLYLFVLTPLLIWGELYVRVIRAYFRAIRVNS